MSVWRSPEHWQPRQFGWAVPAEIPPFVAWLLPAAIGVFAMLAVRSATGAFPAQPERLHQLTVFGDWWAPTLLYSPLWGFPAVIAAMLLRGILLSQGWFGWATALWAGAVAGLAVPLLLGDDLLLDGPLYGAAYLWIQHVIYRATRGAEPRPARL